MAISTEEQDREETKLALQKTRQAIQAGAYITNIWADEGYVRVELSNDDAVLFQETWLEHVLGDIFGWSPAQGDDAEDEDDEDLCRSCGDDYARSSGFCAQCEAEMFL